MRGDLIGRLDEDRVLHHRNDLKTRLQESDPDEKPSLTAGFSCLCLSGGRTRSGRPFQRGAAQKCQAAPIVNVSYSRSAKSGGKKTFSPTALNFARVYSARKLMFVPTMNSVPRPIE